MILRKRGRRLLAGTAALLATAAVVAACSSGEAAPKNKVDAGLSRLSNDLKGGVLTHTIHPAGEQFSVLTSYSTTYAVNSWNITQSKTLNIALKLAGNVPAGTVVYVEHMHADVSIKATQAWLDGTTQDSMDDEVHSGSEPGFLVTKTEAYETVFAIEGYSQDLISGWSYQVGDYGAGQIDDKRLTESNLRNSGGAIGNKFIIIFDLLVQYKGEPGFHKVAIQDAFLVPVSGTPATSS